MEAVCIGNLRDVCLVPLSSCSYYYDGQQENHCSLVDCIENEWVGVGSCKVNDHW